MPLLVLQIKEILVEESNVQPVNSPVTVSWLALCRALTGWAADEQGMACMLHNLVLLSLACSAVSAVAA